MYSTPEDERLTKPKLKADVPGPQRTIPGRIGTPKPIPAGDRSTQPVGQPVKKTAAPNRSTQPVGKPSFPIPNGQRSTPEDEDNPKRKAILKRLRMKQNAQQ